MRKFGLGLITFAAAASAAMAIPGTAHAVASPSTVTVTCSGGALVLSALTVTLDSGDSFTLTNNVGANLRLTLPSGSTATTSVNPLANAASTTITSTAAGSIQVRGSGVSGNCAFSTVFLILDVSGGSDTSATASSPAPVIQQFGKPAFGTCEAATPITLNWGGAGSGGWGESWAQWMNNGNGGAVCTRTLVYSDNLGSWTVG